MLLTCPHCDTIFRVSADSIGVEGRRVRCSVCSHVWQAKGVVDAGDYADSGSEGETEGRGFGGIFIIALSIMALLLLMIGNRDFLVANWGVPRGFYDVLGIEVAPSLEDVRVSGLRAARAHDVVTVSGEVRNGGDWSILSPFLRVTVSDSGGALLAERVISLDSETIEGGASADFCVCVGEFVCVPVSVCARR